MATDRWHPVVLVLLPFLGIIGFVFLFPMGFMGFLSLRTSLGVGSQFTLDNYAIALSTTYLSKYGWSIFASALSSIIAITFGFPIAYFLARGKGIFTAITQVSILVPLFGLTYYAYAFLFSFSFGGIVDYALLNVGLIHQQVNFVIGTNRTVLTIFAMGVTSVPLTSLVMVGAIQGIDPALEEVSLCCGANEFQTFTRVTLALARRSMLAAAILVFGANIVAFTFPLILGLGDNRWIAVEILTLATNFLKYNLTSAIAVVLLAITSVISYAYLRITKG